MTKTFFTSDLHFFHKNILKFARDTRKGDDVDEMNELIILTWNETVSLTDTVYILGDFSFGDSARTEKILSRLNGRLHLIKGNHDYWIDDNTGKYFETIQDYKKLTIDKRKVIMFHYPIAEWDGMHHGAYHLYGHVHGSLQVEGRAMDVGIDARPQKDMGMWEWEEIKKIMEKKPIRTHHGKHEVL